LPQYPLEFGNYYPDPDYNRPVSSAGNRHQISIRASSNMLSTWQNVTYCSKYVT